MRKRLLQFSTLLLIFIFSFGSLLGEGAIFPASAAVYPQTPIMIMDVTGTYVEIKNVTAGDVNLVGWKVASTSKGAFQEFKSSLILASNASCRLMAYGYTPECPSIGQGWVDRDTIYLIDPLGNTIDAMVYVPSNTPTPTVAPTFTPTPTSTPNPNDGFEPNNTDADASDLPINWPLEKANITKGDIDWYRSEMTARTGSYNLTISPSHIAVDLQLNIYISPDLTTPAMQAHVTGTQSSPFHLLFTVPASATYYLKVSGFSPSINYQSFGAYDIAMYYIPPIPGVEDLLEPNNTEAQATISGFSNKVEDLTLYSNTIDQTLLPDQDWFKIQFSKALDWHCDAVSTNTLLDLGFYYHIEGKTNGDMGGLPVEYYANWKNVNPHLVVHNIQPNTTVYIGVYLENASAKDVVGNIKYSFSCEGGLGEVINPKPTVPPSPTKTPSNSGSNTGSGTGNTTSATKGPTSTPMPSVLRFVAKLLGIKTTAKATPAVEYVTTTFRVYTDENNNRAADLNEWISGLRILIVDSITNQIVQVLETNANGPLTLTLTKQQQESYRYAIPLLNINRKLEDDIEIVPSTPDFSSIIP